MKDEGWAAVVAALVDAGGLFGIEVPRGYHPILTKREHVWRVQVSGKVGGELKYYMVVVWVEMTDRRGWEYGFEHTILDYYEDKDPDEL